MNLSYCAQHVLSNDRDRFRMSLFVPETHRETLSVLYALNVELFSIHDHVSEEMIGHIRYAWWQEKIEALYQDQHTVGHPVLEALYPIIALGHLPKDMLIALIASYREHYPALPDDIHDHLRDISLHVITLLCPHAQKPWQKAESIIRSHRARYHGKGNSWLSLRLLLSV